MPDQFNSSFVNPRKKTLDDLAAQHGELRNPPSLRDADIATKTDVLLSNLPGPMGARPGGGMGALLAAGVLPVGTRVFHATRNPFGGFKYRGEAPPSQFTYFGSTPKAAELGAGLMPASQRVFYGGRTTRDLNIHTVADMNPNLVEALKSLKGAPVGQGWGDLHTEYLRQLSMTRKRGVELPWTFAENPAFREALRMSGYHGTLVRDESGTSLGLHPELTEKLVTPGTIFTKSPKRGRQFDHDHRFRNLMKAAGY